jgi:hypothetical protein
VHHKGFSLQNGLCAVNPGHCEANVLERRRLTSLEVNRMDVGIHESLDGWVGGLTDGLESQWANELME